MTRRFAPLLVLAASAVTPFAAGAAEPHSRLLARAVLPAATYRAESPPSGAFLSREERAAAASNGVRGEADGPYLTAQPVQGSSATRRGARRCPASPSTRSRRRRRRAAPTGRSGS